MHVREANGRMRLENRRLNLCSTIVANDTSWPRGDNATCDLLAEDRPLSEGGRGLGQPNWTTTSTAAHGRSGEFASGRLLALQFAENGSG